MKGKRDTNSYHAPDRASKVKALARRLDAHDLGGLGGWFRDERDRHLRAEHLAKCQVIFADMQTWQEGREMQVSRTFLLHNQITPGERLQFLSIYKGRKHIGAWFGRDSGEKIWFALLRLDDLVPYDGKGVTDTEEREYAQLAQAMGELLR
jgi:predicted small integral membrane protein